ncbi:putative phage abortive infection protein [Capnocytophaga canis]|uniref:putative phage abortive infection protein n=1 Tax=Capnocytophaga canis TaxID=1848903 RepID=UPI0037D75AB0
MKLLYSILKKRIAISIVLLILGVFVSILFIGRLWYDGFVNLQMIDSEKAAQTGDFIAGIVGTIFTLIGIILLYETLSLQRQEFVESRKVFQSQQFENKFFSLVELYNNIVSTFHYDVPNSSEKFIGKEYFVKHKEDFISRLKFSKSYLKDQKQIIVCYTQFYLENKEILGQYFRTLYRLFDLIENNVVDKEDKISYIKIIRGQLSESELFFINYNAHTSFGEKFRSYIVNYNLIKHLPILEKAEFYELKSKLISNDKVNAVSAVFEELTKSIKDSKPYYKTYLKGRFAFKITRTEKLIHVELFRNNNVKFSNNLQEGFGLNDFTNDELEKILKYWFMDLFYSRRYISEENKNLMFKVDILPNGNQKTKIECKIQNRDETDLNI